MRIWDLPVQVLCDRHLLGEHKELHCIWTFLTTEKGGSYKKHPETLRWKGKLWALRLRHEEQVKEMTKRGFNHKSPINDLYPVTDRPKPINTLYEQMKIIKKKGCRCRISIISRSSS